MDKGGFERYFEFIRGLDPMRNPIFLTAHPLRESLFRIDGRIRRNIYIYLWFNPCFTFTIALVKFFFTSSPFDDIALELIISFVFASSVIFLRIIPNIIFIFTIGFDLQIAPFLKIFLALVGGFKLATGQYSINHFASILELIIVLWVLKYILRLRQNALKKIPDFNGRAPLVY